MIWIIFFSIIIICICFNLFLEKKYLHKYNILQQSYFFLFFWFFFTCIFSFFYWMFYTRYVNITVANANLILFWLGYFIEQSFSIDNIFVFFFVFQYFHIPIQLHRKVLSIGILITFILRGLIICIGYWVLLYWNWIIFLFSIILLFTGMEIFFFDNSGYKDINKNILLKYINNIFHILPTLKGEKFFIYYKNLLYVTPLFIALIIIELSDIIFSIDSIPAIFSITHDPFIIITSNFFAILGLRSIYFIVVHIMSKLYYIQYLISLVMIFLSVKMILNSFLYIIGNIYAILVSIILFCYLFYNFISKFNLLR